MSTAAQVDPHDKMRARDVNRVARGEQAPRPAHEYGTVSPPPPPTSVHPPPKINRNNLPRPLEEEEDETPADQPRHCYATYVEYLRCVRDKGEEAPKCWRLARHYRAICPLEWIDRWDEERERGTFPPI